MQKAKALLYFTIFIFHFSFSQTWESVGGGMLGGDSLHPPISALCVYRGKLYAAGNFTRVGNRHCDGIASWDGKKWDTVGVGIKGTVYSLAVYNDKLVAAGNFKMRTGGYLFKNIAQWDEKNWSGLGNGFSEGSCSEIDLDGRVRALVVYKNKLYAGGTFKMAGNIHTRDIAAWDGQVWNKVGKDVKNQDAAALDYGIDGGAGSIFALGVYKEKLYVGGYIDKSDGIKIRSIASWDGDKWDSVKYAFLIKNKSYANMLGIYGVFSFAVYNDLLYTAVATDSNMGWYNHIAAWDGNTWHGLGKGTNGLVDGLQVYKDKLYACGVFTIAGSDSAKRVAVWDGNTWEPVGIGFDGVVKYGTNNNIGRAICFAVYKDELYIGGYFTSSGGKPVMNIAKLNLKGTKPITLKKKGNG